MYTKFTAHRPLTCQIAPWRRASPLSCSKQPRLRAQCHQAFTNIEWNDCLNDTNNAELSLQNRQTPYICTSVSETPVWFPWALRLCPVITSVRYFNFFYSILGSGSVKSVETPLRANSSADSLPRIAQCSPNESGIDFY